jgi:predicted transcriptional regulator
MDTSISARTKELLRYFTRLKDAEQKSILQMLKTFVDSRQEEFKPVTLEEYNRELEEADAEIEAGECVSHEEVMKRYFKK